MLGRDCIDVSLPRFDFRVTFVLLILLPTPALAQRAGGAAQVPSAGNQANATGAGAGNTQQPASGQTGLSPDDVFSGVIERGEAVGQAAAPVGASPSSRAAADANRAGGIGGGLGGFGGGGGGLGAMFGNLFNNNSSATSSDSPPLRTRLRSAIIVPLVTADVNVRAAARATSRLRQSPSLQYNPPGPGSNSGYNSPVNRYNGVAVEFRDRTAVLSGNVGSERDRRMSQLMMRLEPGVSRVENRLQVRP